METSDTGKSVSIKASVEQPSTEALTFSVGPRVGLLLTIVFLVPNGVHE